MLRQRAELGSTVIGKAVYTNNWPLCEPEYLAVEKMVKFDRFSPHLDNKNQFRHDYFCIRTSHSYFNGNPERTFYFLMLSR